MSWMGFVAMALVLPGLLTIGGCSTSTVHTQKTRLPLSAIQTPERFQLLVRTGHPTLDKLLYEMAYQKFSDILPLREQGPYTGVMEITFASSGQSASVGSSSTVGNASAYGSGWYSSGGYLGGTATIAGFSTTATSDSSFTWQNSTMLIVLKKLDGERLWTADYNYKGGWEMSGFVVNTPDEAARLVVKRLRDKFQSDFQK
jgi:hypothetical protein